MDGWMNELLQMGNWLKLTHQNMLFVHVVVVMYLVITVRREGKDYIINGTVSVGCLFFVCDWD